MAKRKTYHTCRSGDGSWNVTHGHDIVSTHASQPDAEQHALILGRQAEDDGGLSRVVLHLADGSIREERTYGKDARRLG
jgi:hypothetical protein